jgi:serine/threonine protein phosphatase 1
MVFNRFKRLLTPDAPNLAAAPEGTRLYAIGDIHGRDDLLGALHALIATDLRDNPPQKAEIIYLGDYIDRGADSQKVIDRLIHFKETFPAVKPIFLKGNHEDAMLNFLLDYAIGREWLMYGGQATLYSYGVPLYDFQGATPTVLQSLQEQLRGLLPASHLEFLQRLPLHYESGDYFFAHAGVNPLLRLEEQHHADLLWIRDDFLRSSKNFGKIVVHGHTISRTPEFKHNRIGVDTGAYATGTLTAVVLEGTTQRVLQT